MNGIWIFPCVVVVSVLMMLVFLVADYIRRRRCQHIDVRVVRQHAGESTYLARVCMGCSKTFGEVK